MVVKRIDTDAVKKRRVLRQALADFREGRIHLLLGTQMVAKGLNFPGVKLVGIVNADTGFQMPDFRAAERTFDLLVQVSGRAGRTLPDGTVLIQTFHPENPAIQMAKEGKLEEFYAVELDTRRALAFPPFSRLIRIVVRSSNEKKGTDAIADLGKALSQRLGRAGTVLGPAECPISPDFGQPPLAPHHPDNRVRRGARSAWARSWRSSSRPAACISRWTWTLSRCCRRAAPAIGGIRDFHYY